MPNIEREFVALSAYLKLMSNKGADDNNLHQRRDFLLKLIPLLEGKPQDPEKFRKIVDTVLEGCEKASWPFLLNVALEYYQFWVNDIKAIASLHARGGYEVQPSVPTVPAGDLKTLWKSLENEKFTVTEKWPIKAYAAALREEGAEQDLVDTRSGLVKLLMVRLREVEGSGGDQYRSAVHALLPLFDMKETREMFLAVVREFYYFWIGDPDAAKHLVLKSPD